MGSSINEGTSDHQGFLTQHRSGPGLHTGCSLGRRYPSEVAGTDPAKWATSMATLDVADDIRRAAYAYVSGSGTLAAVDALYATLTTVPSGSPWSVSPAAWWAGLTPAQKDGQCRAALTAWADARFSS